jgi:hypothetical protein
MDNQNRRNFLSHTGKVAPLQPVGNVATGNVHDVKRAAQWVDPYGFYVNHQWWEKPGANLTEAGKQYFREWLEKLKKQNRNFRPQTK